MADSIETLVYSDGFEKNWLFDRYYYGGANSRYWTFQLALNILFQKRKNPVLVETGCQRMEEDLGAGMSTSIFGRYCHQNGGHLHTVDLIQENLDVCKKATEQYSSVISYHCSDSVLWLNENSVPADLLYLDSLDHPYGRLLELYGGKTDIEAAAKALRETPQMEILSKHYELLAPCQEHCLAELLAAKTSGVLTDSTIVMVDDNQLPGGGKSRLVKKHLLSSGWTCLFDLQQTLWVKEL